MNDEGETTILVNDVMLHHGAEGVVSDAVARNGAWNVRMREEGVTVDRTDPANWIISEPDANVVAGRDFSAADFPESCPEGQVGTPPNCTTPPPPMCPEGQVGIPPELHDAAPTHVP